MEMQGRDEQCVQASEEQQDLPQTKQRQPAGAEAGERLRVLLHTLILQQQPPKAVSVA